MVGLETEEELGIPLPFKRCSVCCNKPRTRSCCPSATVVGRFPCEWLPPSSARRPPSAPPSLRPPLRSPDSPGSSDAQGLQVPLSARTPQVLKVLKVSQTAERLPRPVQPSLHHSAQSHSLASPSTLASPPPETQATPLALPALPPWLARLERQALEDPCGDGQRHRRSAWADRWGCARWTRSSSHRRRRSPAAMTDR